MIRFSAESDYIGIVRLWNEAFGDSEKEIKFFLDGCYVPENTLIYEENGEVAAMLFLIEGDMSVKGKDYPSYYLYAACTLKEYRGRGLMGGLLEFAEETAKSRNKFFICLRPGEKSLFDFYEKHGYHTVFKFKNAVLDTDYILSLGADTVSDDACCREKLRNEAFSDHTFFKWDKRFIDFAFSHNDFYGGSSFESCKGYTLYSAYNGNLSVKETTFTDIKAIISSLDTARKSDIKNITLNLPPWYDITGDAIPFAMLCAVSDEGKNLIDSIDNAYLGLTLE